MVKSTRCEEPHNTTLNIKIKQNDWKRAKKKVYIEKDREFKTRTYSLSVQKDSYQKFVL